MPITREAARSGVPRPGNLNFLQVRRRVLCIVATQKTANFAIILMLKAPTSPVVFFQNPSASMRVGPLIELDPCSMELEGNGVCFNAIDEFSVACCLTSDCKDNTCGVITGPRIPGGIGSRINKYRILLIQMESTVSMMDFQPIGETMMAHAFQLGYRIGGDAVIDGPTSGRGAGGRGGLKKREQHHQIIITQCIN